MKVVIISDTHGFHKGLTLPEGDVLIHAGDVSGRGMESQIVDFFDWFGVQNHKHKVMIAGNHDFYFEQACAEEIKKLVPSNVVYLNDSGIEIAGVKIWGSPVSTWFYEWAFNCHRGEEMQKHWDKIPTDTDILVTHGPAFGIRDRTHSGVHVGCERLLSTIHKLRPKFHVFGHIHEGYGVEEQGGVQFVNAAVLSAGYELINPPIVINI